MKTLCLNDTDYQGLFKILNKQYNKEIEASLSSEEMDELNDIANILEQIFKKFKKKFDKKFFIAIIKRLYPSSTIMMGGGDSDKNEFDLSSIRIETPTNETPTNNNRYISRYDFLALIGIVVSIILLCLAFIQINNAVTDITGDNLDLSLVDKDFREIFKQAFKGFNFEQMSFFERIWKALTECSTHTLAKQTNYLTNFIKNIALDESKIFTQDLTNVCLTKSNGALGYVEGIFKTYFTGENTASCMQTQSHIILESMQARQTFFMAQQKLFLKTILNSLKTNTMNVNILINRSAAIGFSSVAYLVYRMKELRNAKIKEKNSMNSHSMKLLKNAGGKKSKKSRKTRKTRKINK